MASNKSEYKNWI